MATTNVIELLADILPVGSIRELAKFDVSRHIEAISTRMNKDKQKIALIIPTILKKAMELGVQFGVEIKSGEPEDGVPDTAISFAGDAKVFIDETVGLARMWADQVSNTLKGDVWNDPTKDEREVTRIWAKRNKVDKAFQDLIGVSEGTPDVYPQNFVDDYL